MREGGRKEGMREDDSNMTAATTTVLKNLQMSVTNGRLLRTETAKSVAKTPRHMCFGNQAAEFNIDYPEAP